MEKTKMNMTAVAEEFRHLDLQFRCGSSRYAERGYVNKLIHAISSKNEVLEREAIKSLGDLYLEKGRVRKDKVAFTIAAGLYRAALDRCEDSDGRETLEHRIKYAEKIRADVEKRGGLRHPLVENSEMGDFEGRSRWLTDKQSAWREAVVLNQRLRTLDKFIDIHSDTAADRSHHRPPENIRKYFFFIKDQVSSDWKDLAFFLGFARTEIHNIDGRNRDGKSRCMDMLEEWRKRRGDSATIDVLMKAMNDASLLTIVDRLKNKYPELNEAPEPVASGTPKRTIMENLEGWNETLATLTVERLQGFKGKKTVHLHPKTTAMVGPNSSGKTTLIRAWLLFATLSYEMSATSSATQSRSKIGFESKLISNSVITDIFELSDIRDFWYRRDTGKPVTISGRDTEGIELQFIINYVTGGTLVRVDKVTNEKTSRLHRPVLAVLNNINRDAYRPQVPVKVPVPSFTVAKFDNTRVFSILCELQQDTTCWDLLNDMLKTIQPRYAIRLISGARRRGEKAIMVREGTLDIPLQICDSGLLQIVAVLVFVLHSLKHFFPQKPFSPNSGERPIATVLLDNISGLLGSGVLGKLLKCLTTTVNCQTVITTLGIEPANQCENMIINKGLSGSHDHGSLATFHGDSMADADISKSLDNMGKAWSALGDHRKAVSYHEQALQIERRIHGEETAHPDIAASLNNLGSAWRNLRDYRKAVSYLEQSLEMLQSIYGEGIPHPDITMLLNNLGVAWSDLGDYRKAISYHEQSLQMRQSIYGKGTEHPDIAGSLNNLGNAWRDLGDHRKAISYHEQALQMRRSIYGKGTEHSDIASSLNNLGAAWSNLGDHRKAISYHEQALQMRQSIYGKGTEHPDIADSLNNLGIIWSHLGDHGKAVSYHEQSLQMRRSIHGEDTEHPDIAALLNNLGIAWNHLGDHRKAISYHEQSLQMMRSIYGEDTEHPDIADSLNSLGIAWGVLGDHRKAASYHEQAHQMSRSIHGEDTEHHIIKNTVAESGS